jgi:hypothetical protein
MKTHFQIAIEELGAFAVPILTIKKQTQTPFLVGTGTLYRSESELFLITAKHVVDELEDGLIVTSGRNGFIRFAADMAAFEYSKGNGRDHDICVVRLPTEAVKNLHTHFKSVEHSDISTVSTYDKFTIYAFVGYPHSKNKPKPKNAVNEIELKPFYYALREFRDINELCCTDKNNEIHVAFDAPFKKSKDVNFQNNIQPPKPNGISGCGVWMMKLDKTSGAVCQRVLVAVGIEYIQSDNAFIATRISSALATINQLEKYGSGSCNQSPCLT